MKNLGTALAVSFLFILPIIVHPGQAGLYVLSDGGYLDACRSLPSGWSSETIYQSKPLSPISLCENGDNDVLILDREAHEIVELELDGSVSSYLSTGNFSFNAIAFQPNADRILALGESAFYVSGSTSFQVIEEHPFDIAFSVCVVDPRDDTFYTGHWANDSTIYHFDSNGALLSSVLSGIQGCAQIALDPANNLLYFSETFPGKITRLNLTSNSTTVLTSGIAIPGTGEGISIAVSPIGDLYYLVAEGVDTGLRKYNGTGFERIMGGKNGIGPIAWSQKFDSVLCAAGYGACIVKYDPDASEPERLTPTVNSGAIVETSAGLLLLGIDDTIYRIEPGAYTEFVTDLDFSCTGMVLDKNDGIYVSLSNDSLLILYLCPNGTYSTWFAGHIDGTLASFSYDSKNDLMILVTSTGAPPQFDLWRVPISNPYDYSKVLTLENVTNGDCTVDKAGNIYVLERSSNALYKIPDGSNETQVIYSNVVEHAVAVAVNIAYCSVLDSIILPRNDDLQVWPVSGGSSYILAVNNVGIDNDGIFENANNELVCTHSGQIYRLSYSEASSPFPIEVVVIVLGVVVAVVVIVVFLRKKS